MNDDVEQFKRELMSYTWHKNKMDELSMQLEELNYRMTGAGCVPISRVSPTVSPSVRSNLGLIDKKDQLIAEYQTHAKQAENVRQAMLLVDEESRVMLENKYIKRVPNILLEKQYGYTSSSINRICNKIIRKIVFLKK